MTYRSAEDIKVEAARRGMRRAFVVTALLSEMEAVKLIVRTTPRLR